MTVLVAVTALLVVLGLATVVGILEARALDAAWGRLALARRASNERERRLVDRQAELDAREQYQPSA